VIKKPWPSMLRTIWRNNDRYIAAYWEKFNNRYYVAGDSAHRDKDGYYWIMGRIDDVLNVAGHRLGTMEVESALVAHPRVAEAAVVGKPHEIKGESVFAFVVCRGQRPTGDTSELVKELRNWVAEQLGAIAKPDDIRFGDNLPKTRSGKIMRRVLKSIARGEEITQDVSTLENPAIIEQLRGVDSADAPSAPAAAKKAGARKKAAGNGEGRKAPPTADAAAADAPKAEVAKANASKANAAKRRSTANTGVGVAKGPVAKKRAASSKDAPAAKSAAPAKPSASGKRAAKKATRATAKSSARASATRAAAKPSTRPSATRRTSKTNTRAKPASRSAKRASAPATKAKAKPAAHRAVKRGKRRR
jgi:hypothetical protein